MGIQYRIVHKKHLVFASQNCVNNESASSSWAAIIVQKIHSNFRHSICNRYKCVWWGRTKSKSTNWSLRQWFCMTRQTIQYVFFRKWKSISVLNDAVQLPTKYRRFFCSFTLTHICISLRLENCFNSNRVCWTKVYEFNRFKNPIS